MLLGSSSSVSSLGDSSTAAAATDVCSWSAGAEDPSNIEIKSWSVVSPSSASPAASSSSAALLSSSMSGSCRLLRATCTKLTCCCSAAAPPAGLDARMSFCRASKAVSMELASCEVAADLFPARSALSSQPCLNEVTKSPKSAVLREWSSKRCFDSDARACITVSAGNRTPSSPCNEFKVCCLLSAKAGGKCGSAWIWLNVCPTRAMFARTDCAAAIASSTAASCSSASARSRACVRPVSSASAPAARRALSHDSAALEVISSSSRLASSKLCRNFCKVWTICAKERWLPWLWPWPERRPPIQPPLLVADEEEVRAFVAEALIAVPPQ
mmetsp:Transcript_99706/g.249984  ORF Transcript_99706/g.249984 Transcript_99706/m.249984 type:complete len:328 (+) Transcript_99706:540-1523(+)